jgi:transposase, IS30 family
MLPVSAKKGVAHMSSYHQLSQEERYIVTGLLVSRHSHAQIARELMRSPSTVCRELARNRNTYDDGYRAEVAHSYATARRKRERRGFHLLQLQWDQVISLLKQKWSPQQISNYLRLHGSFTVSHETIYRYILQDKKQGGELFKHLRIMPKVHRKRYNTRDSRGILPGKRHISTRPAAVETRKQLGHWEGDTVMGSDLHHCILTLVERKSGLALIRKLESRTADAVTAATRRLLARRSLKFKTITFDNGTEFHGYKALEDRFPLKCYFATPYHSWERGSVENLNVLIRQYLPKGASMCTLTQAHCDWIASQLNTRPRKRHGYRSPNQLYYG